MIVGLTGGIGSGKSTVARFFKDLGVPVYIADKEAKKIMTTKAIKEQITSLLGEEAYVNGALNTKYIANSVFHNSLVLGQLNAIVHPAVKKHFMRWQKKQKYPYVIQESAILFENGSASNYDKIILVTAPTSVRIARVTSRDGITPEKVKERMAHQWPDEKKSESADFIINNIDMTITNEKVHEIHKQLLKLSE